MPRARRFRPTLALLLLMLWLAVTALTGRAPEGARTIPAAVSQGVVLQFVFAGGLLAAAALLLRWPDLGFGRPRPGTLRLFWLPGLYLLVIGAAALATGLPPAGVLLILLVNALLGSFSEEVMFRGFLYAGLRDRLPIWPAILVTTVLFGAVHVLNVFLLGHLAAAVFQSLAAMFSGLLYLALRIRTGSLWPVILFHAAWNYGLILIGLDAPPLEPGESIPLLAVIVTFSAILPIGIYPFWLLRGIGRRGDGLGPAPTGPWLQARAAHRT